MSESTPETTSRSHLKPVREETPSPAPAPSAPARPGGGHLTGLLALLLAVAVFAFLAQFSSNQELSARNEALQAELTATQAELQASRAQMDEARSAVGGLRDLLVRIEGLLAPAEASSSAVPEPAAVSAPAAE